MIVALYLSAIVLANLTVAYFGPASSVVIAFLFIGLDITSRDILHEQWQKNNLWPKIAALIISGSVISYALNRNAGSIALASFVAFAGAGIADTVVYHLLKQYPRFYRINGSNVVSALVDSLIFPTLAFGGFLPIVVLGQFLAKTIGGYVWSVALTQFVWNRVQKSS